MAAPGAGEFRPSPRRELRSRRNAAAERARSCERHASTWPIRVRVQQAADRSAARTRGSDNRESEHESERESAREQRGSSSDERERKGERGESARESERQEEAAPATNRAAGAGSSKGERAQRNIRGMVHVLFFLDLDLSLLSPSSLALVSLARSRRIDTSAPSHTHPLHNRHLPTQ